MQSLTREDGTVFAIDTWSDLMLMDKLLWTHERCVQGMHAALWARDVRAAIFLLLIFRCSLDKAALQQAGGEGLFVDLLTDADPRVRFHAAVFLQQRLRTTRPEVSHIGTSVSLLQLWHACDSSASPCCLTARESTNPSLNARFPQVSQN